MQGTGAARVLTAQTAIGVAISALIGGFMAWRLFHDEPVLRFGGIGNVAFSLLPGTLLPVFMMTWGITGQVRGHVAAGRATALPSRLPTLLPRHPLVRALVMATAGVLLLGGAGVAILHALWFEPMNFRFVFVFEVLYAVMVAMLVVPVIVVAALGDAVPGAAPAHIH